jgi:DNA-directed RNA polymerase specialized sigma54-like protein
MLAKEQIDIARRTVAKYRADGNSPVVEAQAVY